ncbi:MAG: formylglycine-generating enzyme family protein [bacterium]
MTRWPPVQATGSPPDWASGWGEDDHGAFVGLTVGDATQRLRWIPPGTFTMGSPAGEAGRWDDEGPQHEVTLTRGFWLGDTPVTQALWRAVMGENPSRFEDMDRPVERVSWEEAVAFMSALGPHLAGDLPRLPTEAEWERACRAGTDAAIWTGEWALLGDNNAPALHDIAWYGGNSGEAFDRDDGVDSTGWPEKQSRTPGAPEGGLKALNLWGLYDMLGNAWGVRRPWSAHLHHRCSRPLQASRLPTGSTVAAPDLERQERPGGVPELSGSGGRTHGPGLAAVQPAEPPGPAGSGQLAGGGPRPAAGAGSSPRSAAGRADSKCRGLRLRAAVVLTLVAKQACLALDQP